jgi:hypothetical protein
MYRPDVCGIGAKVQPVDRKGGERQQVESWCSFGAVVLVNGKRIGWFLRRKQ